jgi:hypothetical protein
MGVESGWGAARRLPAPAPGRACVIEAQRRQPRYDVQQAAQVRKIAAASNDVTAAGPGDAAPFKPFEDVALAETSDANRHWFAFPSRNRHGRRRARSLPLSSVGNPPIFQRRRTMTQQNGNEAQRNEGSQREGQRGQEAQREGQRGQGQQTQEQGQRGQQGGSQREEGGNANQGSNREEGNRQQQQR